MVVTPKIIHNPKPGRNFCQCSEQSALAEVAACCIAEILRNMARAYLGSDTGQGSQGPSRDLVGRSRVEEGVF